MCFEVYPWFKRWLYIAFAYISGVCCEIYMNRRAVAMAVLSVMLIVYTKQFSDHREALDNTPNVRTSNRAYICECALYILDLILCAQSIDQIRLRHFVCALSSPTSKSFYHNYCVFQDTAPHPTLSFTVDIFHMGFIHLYIDATRRKWSRINRQAKQASHFGRPIGFRMGDFNYCALLIVCMC